MRSLKAAVQRRGLTPPSISAVDLLRLYQPVPYDSVKALLRRMGPFQPATDAFRFSNGTDFSAAELEELSGIVPTTLLNLVHLACVTEVKKTLESISIEAGVKVSLYDILGASVIEGLSGEWFLKLLAEIVEPIKHRVTHGGACGGMAFAGYDFYLHGWPVGHLGAAYPTSGALHDFIFQRLLNSLDLNGATFVDWWAKVHVLPKVATVVNAAVLSAAGGVAFPLGTAVGAWIGGRTHLFDFGGPQLLLGPTKAQWPAIKDKLDQEPAWPVGLIYSDSGNLLDQHQVLACGYTDNGVEQTLEIWDNNDANRATILDIDFRGPEVSVAARSGNLQYANRHIKGFFLEEYVARQPPASLGPP